MSPCQAGVLCTFDLLHHALECGEQFPVDVVTEDMVVRPFVVARYR